ncbi:type VI secretion system baseplate subunit TssG [Nitrospirillum iridis]|uniref:Type VI secretion system protein ImpH n=1 Tax=Nitrospirillum iridis TaxID=765888 RepID=A0A7X0B004_9PROT|nr:type VI secretion system baseplate subunit TssG [Nitrospirillum iridis]MBB6253238.1 type VI secretion system protein ImpH [Nitrospirillum iridis]
MNAIVPTPPLMGPPALIDLLRQEPFRFDLFRAIQLLERQFGGAEEDELPIRFAANQSLCFPAHEIQRLHLPRLADAGAEPARLDLNVMTLTGPVSALPQAYTETAIRSLRDRTPGFAAFLDLFNDRIATLLFRAWRRYRLPALYEHRGLEGGDAATSALFGIAGFGTGHLRGRLSVRDEVAVFYAGLFSQQPRAAISLERLLADACGLPVKVEQFAGRWVAIPAEEQTRLRLSAGKGGDKTPTYNRLGVDAVAGARMWDVQGQFRIILGPLTRRQFMDHLPGRPGLRRLVELARLYTGPELGFDVKLVLHREEVPPCALDGREGTGPRLGYDSWLASLPMLTDPDDAVISTKDIDWR